MPVPVALTGATGFIGNAFLALLKRRGHPVRALSRRPRANEPGVEWICGDLHQKGVLSTLVNGARAVVHCAGAVRGAGPEHFHRVNVEGTGNLASAACLVEPPPRFLLVSSLAAREPGLSWYASSKRLSEERLAALAGPMPWTIFRPTAVYGPGDREIRPLLIAMRRGFLPVVETASTRFSLIHIEDLARAILAWVDAPAAPAGIFELDDGTPGGYDWPAIAAIAEKRWQRRVRMVQIPVAALNFIALLNLYLARLFRRAPMLTPSKVRELTHPNWVCDNTAVTRVLEWKPAIRFEDALQRNSIKL